MSVGIYIDTPHHSLLGDRWFVRNTGKFHSSLARCLTFIKDRFEAQGVEVHTADLLPPPRAGAKSLYVSVCNYRNFGILDGRPDVIPSAFLVTETAIVEPRIYRALPEAERRFKRIYSCIDQEEVGEFAGQSVRCEPLRWPMDFHGVDPALWSRSDRAFLVMINMNKMPRLTRYELYTERIRAVEYFSRTGEIDLYGVGWNRASERMGRSWLPWTLRRAQLQVNDWIDRIHPDPMLVAARKVYKGELETKWETLARYDFVLCFENTLRKGWLTEKIFEALRVGTVPVYWGATDISSLIPYECFVDMRDFKDYAELHRFLRSLDRAAVQRYRDAGRAFLESPAFEPFSREALARLFARFLAEDAGVEVRP